MWNLFFKDVVDRRVDERINEILSREEMFTFRELPQPKVNKEVSSYILEKKKEGVTTLSTLDFVFGLKIPADKIEVALDRLQREKKVKELDSTNA